MPPNSCRESGCKTQREFILVPNPLHILEQNLLAATVIKLCRQAVGVAGDSLSGFQGAVIFQKVRDPGGPERVKRIVGRQSSLLEHVRGVSAQKGIHSPLSFILRVITSFIIHYSKGPALSR
jgi:hypothetical protein